MRNRSWSDTYIHFSITINTLYIIVKVKVDDLLRHVYTSCTITPTITSFVIMNTIIQMRIRTRYKQQSTMVAWNMGVRVAGMGPISISSITTNSFSHIARVRVDGLFKPRSTSSVINYYITPWAAIIMDYILPYYFHHKNLYHPSIFRGHFHLTTRRNWQSRKYTTVTWVMGIKLADMIPIPTSHFNINSCSIIGIGRLFGLLWSRYMSSNITTVITYVVMIGRVAGLKRLMSTSSITQRHLNRGSTALKKSVSPIIGVIFQ